VRAGPDLHVTGLRFGRTAAMPLEAVELVAAIPGVAAVVPRVVGELNIGARGDSAVVVGIAAAGLDPSLEFIEGRPFADGATNELVLGSDLAERLKLGVGDAVPPFYRNDRGERVSHVVGVFRSDAPLWQSHLMFVSLETAAALFDEPGMVTELLVSCPETFQKPVAERLRGLRSLDPRPNAPAVRARVAARGDVEAMLLRRVLDRETLFHLPFVVAFALGIGIVLVTSGAGLVERRRETGLLRAMGWSRDALLLRALVESAVLAVASASTAILLAFLWLRLLGGAGLAPVLLPGAQRLPASGVPWTLTPVPALLAVLVATVLVAAGTLYSTWRATSAPPAEAMR
jgi:ABC-type lipoprotein release transport system permease subunit